MSNVRRLLESAANGGGISSDEWPQAHDFIIQRLNTIISDEFPQHQQSSSQPRSSTEDLANRTSNAENKENDIQNITSQTELDFLGQPKSQMTPLDLCEALHAEILANLALFSANPPHTVQRLAELVLNPKEYYQYLSPYLHAIRRIVSVSSDTTVFPLSFQPPIATGAPMGLITDGDSDLTLGSDESLGGALLTPIPWLTHLPPSDEIHRELQETAQKLQDQQAIHISDRTQSSALTEQDLSSPSTHIVGVSSVESDLREEGGVTQGELLRLEQEAGIVSNANNPSDSDASLEDDLVINTPSSEGEDELPHARGPEEIGIEDTGPPTGPGGIAGILQAKIVGDEKKHSIHEGNILEGDDSEKTVNT